MSSIRIRVMDAGDVGFADKLRAAAGWNQTTSDWERFLRMETTGCFLAEWNGQLAGTATTTRYGPDLAWVGMLLVHPDYRRQGIGTALLDHCLAHLAKLQIRCVKLDATPLGRPLYEKLGFQAEWPLARWESAARGWPRSSGVTAVRAGRPEDLGAIAELDSRAFGINRRALLEALAAQASCHLVVAEPGGRVSGFGMLREGARAWYLGPLAAESSGVAAELVRALLEGAGGRGVFWDIPDPNTAAWRLAESLGFVRQRPLLRMYRDENASPGDPQLQYGIAEPAVG